MLRELQTVSGMMCVNSHAIGPKLSLIIIIQQVFSPVTVTDISNLSPTVKGFILQVANRNLKFSAGQW